MNGPTNQMMDLNFNFFFGPVYVRNDPFVATTGFWGEGKIDKTLRRS